VSLALELDIEQVDPHVLATHPRLGGISWPVPEGRVSPGGCGGGIVVVMEDEILARSGEKDKQVGRIDR
jgi:hypothetical protein